MGYTKAFSDLTAANLADDAAKIAYAQAVTYTWRSYFVSYRTFRDLFAKAVADEGTNRDLQGRVESLESTHRKGLWAIGAVSATVAMFAGLIKDAVVIFLTGHK